MVETIVDGGGSQRLNHGILAGPQSLEVLRPLRDRKSFFPFAFPCPLLVGASTQAKESQGTGPPIG